LIVEGVFVVVAVNVLIPRSAPSVTAAMSN
jgi:hypothetical protein